MPLCQVLLLAVFSVLSVSAIQIFPPQVQEGAATNSTAPPVSSAAAFQQNLTSMMSVPPMQSLTHGLHKQLGELGVDGHIIVKHQSCTAILVGTNYTSVPLFPEVIIYQGQVYPVVGTDPAGNPIVCKELVLNVDAGILLAAARFRLTQYILTYLFGIVAVIEEAAIVITYSFLPALRTVFALILVNITAAFMFGDFFTILAVPVAGSTGNLGLCTASAIFVHFFILMQYFWTVMLCYNMFRRYTDLAYERLPASYEQKRKSVVAYCCISWISPLLIVLLTTISNFISKDVVDYGRDGRCYITVQGSVVLALIIPCFGCLFFCVFFLVRTYYNLYTLLFDYSKRDKAVFAVLIACLVLGLVNVILLGILFLLRVDQVTSIFYMIFLLLIPVRSNILFFFFIFNRKVLNAFRKRLNLRGATVHPAYAVRTPAVVVTSSSDSREARDKMFIVTDIPVVQGPHTSSQSNVFDLLKEPTQDSDQDSEMN